MSIDLTYFMYQRQRETIVSVRPDPVGALLARRSAVPAADSRAMSEDDRVVVLPPLRDAAITRQE
jgi:hypothetical protein